MIKINKLKRINQNFHSIFKNYSSLFFQKNKFFTHYTLLKISDVSFSYFLFNSTKNNFFC